MNAEFVNEVVREIELIVGGNATVKCTEVLKNNGVRLHGITILMPGENISPTVYIENYIDNSVRNIAKKIIAEIAKAMELSPQINPEDILNLDKVLDKICLRLINASNNKELLKTVPYEPFYDLAKILVIELGEGVSIKVTNDMLNMWKVNFADLLLVARVNTKRIFPAKIDSMFNIMMKLMSKETGIPVEVLKKSNKLMDDGFMYVLTNEIGVNGATCILYNDILKEFAEKIDSDFVILPSSIHEVILQKIDSHISHITIEQLNQLVTEVNQHEVPTQDVLSDHIYIYRRETNSLEY